MPAAAGRMPAVPKTNEPDWTILHNKLPPTQRVGLVRPPPAAAGSSSHSSFCEEVFPAVVGIVNPGRRDRHDGYSRMRWTGQIFWLLAYDACAAPNLLPAFTAFLCPECFRGTTNEPQAARLPLQRLAQWEVVSSYSSATAPDSHGISCADPRFQTRKELKRGLAAHARRCKNYLSHGDKSPTQGYDRGVGCHCFFLLRESLKNHVAFVTRRDRAGDVPKIIGSVLFNHTVENSLKLCADLSGRVQVVLMILLPRIERLRLCQNFLQKFVADDQLARRFKRTDRATKPQQCFLIDRIVREILDDYAPALGQAFRCACNRFIERMNVMEGTRKQDCIKLATIKIWPPR